jgi:predicted dehydrogenase
MEPILKPKLAVIGAGSIAKSHLNAAVAAGFELSAICGSDGSLRAKELSSEYKELRYFENYDLLIRSNFDAISLITSTIPTWDIFLKIEKLNKPILIEKPVTMKLDKFKNHNLENLKVVVGYNRRFYSSINKLKDKLIKEEFYFARFNISELSWDSNSLIEKQHETILENSVHSLDLVHYLFGFIEIMSISKNTIGESLNSIIVLAKDKNDKTIEIGITFGIPINTSIEVWFHNSVAVCKPIEEYEEFEGMQMIQPNEASTYKRYIPIKVDSWKISKGDQILKPGFLEQYKEFLLIVDGKSAKNIANLQDAKKALELATKIIGHE